MPNGRCSDIANHSISTSANLFQAVPPPGGTRNPELEINGSQADVPETRHCQGGSGGYGSSDRVLIEPPEMACYGGSSNSHFIPLALMLNNSEVHPDLTLMLQ